MSQPVPTTQTLSFLIARFREVGIEPRKRHGQNFLIDLNLLRVLVDAAQLSPDDVVLEVGTGTGSLTGLMARSAAAVISVEVDPQLHQLASEELFGIDNVTLLLQDALHNKNTLSSALLDAVAAELAKRPGLRFKLAANLPYNIATPIVANLLESALPPESMTITIQKELADRMMAVPGTKDYGSLSIWVQSQCHVQLVRVLPPTVFWPRPKVTSAIVRLDRDPALCARIEDRTFFHHFVRSLFMHRRKFLRSELLASYKDTLGKPGVDAVLAELALPAEARAEQLDVPAVIALAAAVRRRLPQTDAAAP